jgi:hypothetical protein
MAEKKKTGWTPGKGGSKASQDYYREKQAEYGRRPDQGSRRTKKDARIKQAEKTRNRILQEAQKNPNFVIDPELFTRNKAGISNADPTGKLREGMTGAEYHDFMRQLHGANPAAMEKAFPWGSGKGLRSLANLAMPAPLKMFGEMAGDMGTAVKQGLSKAFPGPAKDLGSEWERFSSNFPWNRKKNEKISETLEMITDPSQNIYDIHPGSAIQPESENIFTEQFDVGPDANVSDWSDYTQKFQGQPGFDEPEPRWEHYDDEGYGFGQFGDQFSQGDQLSELGLPADMGWQKDPYEKLSLDELINLGASQEQIADYLNISQAAGGGLASIDPYRGTMGGGMNPSGWSPDPTARSVTGYEKGGLMNNGNPVDYHNLRNTNKYYGSF